MIITFLNYPDFNDGWFSYKRKILIISCYKNINVAHLTKFNAGSNLHLNLSLYRDKIKPNPKIDQGGDYLLIFISSGMFF